MKPKISRWKEITETRREINEIKIKKTTEMINEKEAPLFFEKINKID